MDKEVRLDLPCEPANVAVVRDEVADLARSVGAEIDDVRIAVGEAAGNAVLHAYRGARAGMIRVRARFARDRLLVTVADDGVGMKPNPDSRGLRMGISLITTLCEDVRFISSDTGTTVSMSFAASGESA